MADNIDVKDAAGATKTVAADDIGSGVLAERNKLVFGVDGTGTEVTPSVGYPVDPLDRTARHLGQVDAFPADSTASGTLTASGQSTTLANPGGLQGFHASLTGTMSGVSVIQWEGSIDGGSTYFALPTASLNTVSPTLQTNSTAFGPFYVQGDFSGLTHMRARCSAFQTADSIVVTIRGSVASPGVIGIGKLATELPGAAALSDASGTGSTTSVGAFDHVYNGTNWDRLRGNLEGTALASAARTTTAGGTSADIVNYNARGVQIILNVTSAGTGSIQANVQGKDPVSGNYYKLAADPTAVTTAITTVYEFYPGASTAAAGGITVRTAAVLPRTWRVIVTHGNANTITYSVGYSMIV